MAYQTYITEALVCGSYHRNGADKSFRLFTRDAGMLFATARSVREERSRQRFALQDFSFVRVSLVKGKADWRIGSVEVDHNLFSTATDRQTRGLVVFGVKLLNRFLSGEEPHQEVFEEAKQFFNYVRNAEQLDTEQAMMLFELRLLRLLGYVKPTSLLTPLLDSGQSYEEMLKTMTNEQQQAAETVIKMGREVSHL